MRPSREEHELELLIAALRAGQSVQIRAFGTSMLPSLWPGDIVTIQGFDRQSVSVGDILAVVSGCTLLIHRLVAMDNAEDRLRLILRGDAMPQDDPPFRLSQLLGKVCRVERGHRAFDPGRSAPSVRRLMGKALCHFDQLRSLALRVHNAAMHM